MIFDNMMEIIIDNMMEILEHDGIYFIKIIDSFNNFDIWIITKASCTLFIFKYEYIYIIGQSTWWSPQSLRNMTNECSNNTFMRIDCGSSYIYSTLYVWKER